MQTLRTLFFAAAALVMSLPAPTFAIDAERGKSYLLSKDHGPWMVMVATFKSVPEERRKEGGLNARQAADELVYELRTLGIPAYVYESKGRVEHLQTVDRMGREDDRVFAAQRGMISVLAGNYKSVEDPVAQKTLAYIKKFNPKFIQDPKNGAIYRQTPGRQGPLSGAFLTLNPLGGNSSHTKQERDPLLVKLNSGLQNGLVSAKGKYTLQVATFSGRSVNTIGESAYQKSIARLDKQLNEETQINLNTAGEDAEQLATALRKRGYEAYVYHGYYESFVSVGSFDSKDDPRIRTFAKMFAASMKKNQETGTEAFVSEMLTLPGAKPNDPPVKTWLFDPYPQVIDIPRV